MSQFLAPVLADAEEEVERTLRPRSLADFVGQDRVKEQLEIALDGGEGARRGARPSAARRAAGTGEDVARADRA